MMPSMMCAAVICVRPELYWRWLFNHWVSMSGVRAAVDFKVIFFCRCWNWQAGWTLVPIEYNVRFWMNWTERRMDFVEFIIYIFWVAAFYRNCILYVYHPVYNRIMQLRRKAVSTFTLKYTNVYVVIFSFQYDSRLWSFKWYCQALTQKS